MLKLNIQMFATQTYTGTCDGQYGHLVSFYAIRTYTQDETTIPATTEEKIDIYIKKLNSAMLSHNAAAPYTIKDGTALLESGTCSFDIRNLAVGASQKVLSYSRTLEHADDGTYPDYTLNVTLNTQVSIGNAKISKVVTTPTINTAYAVAGQDLDISTNSAMPIIVGVRENTGYTFDLIYEYKTSSATTHTGTIVSAQTTSPVLWELSQGEISVLKSTMSETNKLPVTISCITKKDGIQIGVTKTSTVNFIITEKGIVNSITPEEMVTKIKALTNSVSIVKELSKIKYTYDLKAPFGTEIKTYVAKIGSRTLTSETNTIVVENISEGVDGGVDTVLYGIDKRGNETEAIVGKTPIIDYIKAEYKNTECIVKRTESDIDNISVYLTASYFNDIIGVTNNSVTLGYKYREKGVTTYTTGITQLTLNNEITLDEIFDHTKNYELVFTIEDLIYVGSEMSKTVPSSQYVMFEHEKGVDFLNATIMGKQINTEGSDIIREVRMNEDTALVEFDNLNIADNDVYEILIRGAASADADLKMLVNDMTTSSYNQQGVYWQGTRTTTGSVSSTAGYRPAFDRFYYALSMRTTPGIIKIDCSINSNYFICTWSSNFTKQGNQIISLCSGCLENVEKIDKLSFSLASGVFKAGTIITLRKK